MQITPQDEFFHDLEDPLFGNWDRSGWFNESGWFNFNVPERNIDGLLYVHHRPNHTVTWAGMCVWDDTGHYFNDCLWADWGLHPTPETDKVFDFSLKTGLTYEMVEPLKTYRFRNHPDGWNHSVPGEFEAELEWNAFIGPQEGNKVAIPDEWKQWFAGHYEQFGRMTGYLQIKDERIEVDCYAARDRSFGPHDMNNVGRGDQAWGIANEELGFFAYAVSDVDPTTDPLFGTTEPLVGGWYLADGKVGTVVEGERTATDRHPDTRMISQVITARDDLGREFRAEGNCTNHLFFDGFAECWWWWGLMRWQINGVDAIGETIDNMTSRMWQRIMRQRAQELAGARS
jgi:hypothetical protein